MNSATDWELALLGERGILLGQSQRRGGAGSSPAGTSREARASDLSSPVLIRTPGLHLWVTRSCLSAREGLRLGTLRPVGVDCVLLSCPCARYSAPSALVATADKEGSLSDTPDVKTN